MTGLGGEQSAQITVSRTGTVLVTGAKTANSVKDRMVGLLGRAGLEAGEGLILPGCQSVHTCGMQFVIDVVFVDRDWRVVAMCQRLRPWRMTPWIWAAKHVIELPEGAIHGAQIEVGEQLVLEAN